MNSKIVRGLQAALEHAQRFGRRWRDEDGGIWGESPTPKPKSGDGAKKKDLENA